MKNCLATSQKAVCFFVYFFLIQFHTACSETIKTDPAYLSAVNSRPASIGIIGDTADIEAPVNGGIVLMGGGSDVQSAFKWMIGRSGGGDVVIIRASGTDAYNSFVYHLGNVNSVETLKIDSRELADNDTVADIIRNAEMLFIAGGNQANYMNFWRGTKTNDAINYLLNTKKAPVGGTSAGCAVLSGFYYSGENGGITSAEAMSDPWNSKVTLYNNDFLHAPFLSNVVTDQHYLAREREGRHLVFIARIYNDFNVAALGIAADEKTAVCIDENGIAEVFGTSRAYFIIQSEAKRPEQFSRGNIVTWKHNQKAVIVYEIEAATTGNGSFNVNTFSESDAAGGKWFWWWIDNGILYKRERE